MIFGIIAAKACKKHRHQCNLRTLKSKIAKVACKNTKKPPKSFQWQNHSSRPSLQSNQTTNITRRSAPKEHSPGFEQSLVGVTQQDYLAVNPSELPLPPSYESTFGLTNSPAYTKREQ